MSGYRAIIAADNFDGRAAEHYAGAGQIDDVPVVPCPNCGRTLFPALNLSFADLRLRDLGVWEEPYARFLICVACAHYMAPYFVHHKPALGVAGGELDGGAILIDVATPYPARLVNLVPLSNASPEVPRHQIGGSPIDASVDNGTCPVCLAPMLFFGILDDDDLNAPLYEADGSPVALVIGDDDYLHVSACNPCAVLRFTWVR